MQLLTAFALLIPAFSLLYPPQPLALLFHRVYNAPLEVYKRQVKMRFLHLDNSNRRLPIFTSRVQLTIFGTRELNFCVRNGNRWFLTVIDTGHS